MGGMITVGFRFQDGKRHVRQRWTNPLPYVVHDIHMIRGDRVYIDDYLRDGEDASEHALAPCGYGFVYLDWKANALLSSQNYSTMGSISPMFMSRWHFKNEPEDRSRVEAMLRAGVLTRRTLCWKMNGRKIKHISNVDDPIVADLSFEALVEMAEEFESKNSRTGQRERAMRKSGNTQENSGLSETHHQDIYEHLEFGVNMSPLRVEDLRNMGLEEQRERFRQIGALTDADEVAWGECIRERDDWIAQVHEKKTARLS